MMEATYQSPTSSHDENILNILMFQQDGSNVPVLEQSLSMSHDMHLPDGQRALTLAALPSLGDGSLGGSLSSCPSQNEVLPSYSWFQRAAKASSTPRPSLHKSPSFTVGQCEVESQYPHFDDLRTMSEFCNNPLKWDRNILSNPMETNNEHTCPSQLSLKADTMLLKGRGHKMMKHESLSSPVGVNGVDALPPDLLMANLGQSSIHSLTATPDSGFWTPGSSITEEPLSAAALMLPTPKRLKFEDKSQHADVESPNAVNTVLVDPLLNITSIASGSQQTLSTPLSHFSITPMVCSKQAMSNPLPQLNITRKQTSAPQSQLSLTTKQTVFATLPQLRNTPISKVPSLQQRNVLQELNSNICYNPTSKTQPVQPDYEQPSYSYKDLIKMALKESKDGQLALKEIMAWIEDHFPFFKYKATQGWKSSVRCNLSLNQDFVKVDGEKRGGKWKVAEDARSHLHRLAKPPVMKQLAAPKVPAVTRLKSCRSGPLPILPKSVPYTLVSLGLPTLEEKNKTQNIHDQAMQILQQQRSPVLQPLQVQQIFHNQQPQIHVITSQHQLTSASSANPHQPKASLQQIFYNQQPQTHVITSQHQLTSASSANPHQPEASLQQIFYNQQPQTHVITSQHQLTSASSVNSHQPEASLQQIFYNQQSQTHVITSQHPIVSASSVNSHQPEASLQQIFHNQQPQTHVITSQHPIVSASSVNSHQPEASLQQIFYNQQPQTHVITSQHPIVSASSVNSHQPEASLQQIFYNQQPQTHVITSQHPIVSASSVNSHQPEASLQQIFYNLQPQTYVITSQHPLTSANSLQTNASLQQVTPKLNVNPTTLVLDSKSFVMPSCKDGGQADKVHLEFQSVYVKGCTNQRAGVNTSSLNVTTLDIGKQGLVSRPSISDNILQPVGIQIQQGNLSNEKKIVFTLKQPQGQEKQINKVPAGIPTDYKSRCLIRNNQLPKHTPALVPLKARSICKTVDQIQRSKSDEWNESTCVKPYSKGKNGNSSRKAPIVNIDHLLKEGKQHEKVAKIFFMDVDDCDSDLRGKLPSNLCDSSKKSVTPRPDSAPAMCLIQQAWEQANLMSDSDDIDCLLLDSHSSGDHVDSNKHDHATDEDQTVFSSSPDKVEVPAASEDQQDIYYVACSNFPNLPKDLNQPIIQSTTSCHSNTNAAQHASKEYRSVSSRNEDITNMEESSRLISISENVMPAIVSSENMQTIHKNKNVKFITISKKCERKENQIPIPVIADKTVSARKIIFHGMPNSHEDFSSLPSSSGSKSSIIDSLCQQEPALQATTACSPQLTLNWMKSKRKQIYTSLSTDIDISEDKGTACLDSTSVRNHLVKTSSSVDSTGVNRERAHLFQTPPVGTHHTIQDTSSPNSENHSPLDFAAFLATLSTSPCSKLNVDNALPSGQVDLMTPPVGTRPVPITSTSTFGMKLPQENQESLTNPSSVFDSSLFDSLNSFL